MKDFNLKEALAGAKVVTNSGDEVTQLTLMNVDGIDNLVAVYKDEVLRWNIRGCNLRISSNVSLDLKMAPVMGSGFLYVFANGCTTMSKERRGNYLNYSMCFDLSKYPIGFGL